jgi:hypothetical protein
MHGRLRFLAPVVGLLLIVAFAFTAAPARADMGRPAWASGDFWVYDFSSGLSNVSTNGTLRMDVTGTESVTVNGTSYPTYHVAAALTFKFGPFTFNQPADIWYSSDTLAIVKIAASIDLSFGTIILKSHVSIAGNPPQTINWPLTAGAQWDSSTTVWTATTNTTGVTRYMSAPLSTHFAVQADATITVPAGTFTTSPVKQTSSGSTSFILNYWSPQAGNSVRTESHNSSGTSAGGYNLTSYRYQAGNFFTTVFVGLPVWIWLLVIVLVAAAVVVIVSVRRRKPRMGAPPSPPPPETP